VENERADQWRLSETSTIVSGQKTKMLNLNGKCRELHLMPAADGDAPAGRHSRRASGPVPGPGARARLSRGRPGTDAPPVPQVAPAFNDPPQPEYEPRLVQPRYEPGPPPGYEPRVASLSCPPGLAYYGQPQAVPPYDNDECPDELAGLILAKGDQQAATITRQASREAAEITRHASRQAAATIRQAAEEATTQLVTAAMQRVSAAVRLTPDAPARPGTWPGRTARHASSPPTLIAHRLSAESDGKPRLTDMSFVQRENQLVAVLGPSGAGKTSLFSAIVGELTLTEGDLYFGELSLRTRGREIRGQLGFVPQDEHLFRSLTVRQLLRYSFELRIASTRADRDERIAKVCEQLKIVGQLDQLVGTLSGGQRKRVSLAVELVSEPALLMLDEPTSGLDAGMDREILEQLRDCVRQGMTVIVITHSTEHLNLVDQVLVLASGGRPVYFGPPGEVLTELGVPTYAALMQQLISDPTGAAAAYQAGDAEREAAIEARRMARLPSGPNADGTSRRRPLTGLRQFWVLVRRQATLVLRRGSVNRSDEAARVLRRLSGFLGEFAPLLITAAAAVLTGLASGAHGLAASRGIPGLATPETALTLVVTLSVLSGQTLTYSDIVSDLPTIRREHRTGILTLPVLLSKWLVFAFLAVLQSLVITCSYLLVRPGPAYSLVLQHPDAELFVDLAAMSVAAMTLGLLISAAMPRLDQAIMLVTGLSVAQITLNGIVTGLSGKLELNVLSMIFPSRWGLAATGASMNLSKISPLMSQDGLWSHTVQQWRIDLGELGVLTAVYFLLACWLLARRLKRSD
jgi:ABC-type multidrug transport system ATPase subunit